MGRRGGGDALAWVRLRPAEERGTLTVQLTDNSLCAQGTYCSAAATINVT